jgi:hypothetical protein
MVSILCICGMAARLWPESASHGRKQLAVMHYCRTVMEGTRTCWKIHTKVVLGSGIYHKVPPGIQRRCFVLRDDLDLDSDLECGVESIRYGSWPRPSFVSHSSQATPQSVRLFPKMTTEYVIKLPELKYIESSSNI